MKYVLIFLLLIQSFENDTIHYCDGLIKRGLEAHINKNYLKSLELLTEAQTLAKKNNWQKELFNATNGIGVNYYEMLDYGEALDNYLQAYTIALKVMDTKQESIVLNNIAVLYRDEKKYNEAEIYQKKAFDIFVKVKDSFEIAVSATNLAGLYNETNKLELASKYIDIAKIMAPKNLETVIYTSIIEAENLLDKNEFDASEKIINRLNGKLESTELNNSKIAVLLLLSKIYEHQNHIEKALNSTKQAKEESLSYKNNIHIYDRFSEVYFAMKDFEKSIKYKDSVMLVKDSISVLKDRVVYENSKIKFEIKDSQKQLLVSQDQLNNEKLIKYYLIGFSLLIFTLLGWLLRSNYIKYRQKRIISVNSQEIIALELKNKENDNLLLEQQMKEKEILSLLERNNHKLELERKNRKLVANVLQLGQRNENIKNFVKSLSQNSELSKNIFLAKQIELLKNILSKEESNDEFLSHFEEINSHFLKSIKEMHPTLNANDIRFLCYMYMNLSGKEISTLFNITIQATRKRKERIAIKMNLLEGSQLYGYITTI
ncbi:tetratricopeptide repeat protein [Bizionia arctica]|uniref:Tetratricopeptide repeat protein n=1 Tax=Bizionia arctica TaxID=1495645 RepID=A0A917GMM0_9FLAO|nr:tetratricopeptide repeat protein [Bizionia arctica]GGG51927.1 hypothetical protein GCM10010976_23860 [Bizionia arctica]